MPAWIDPEQRRQQVVEAAFRLVVAEGVEGVSLRKAADQSGLNTGSVRRYLDGHHDLLAAELDVTEGQAGRLVTVFSLTVALTAPVSAVVLASVPRHRLARQRCWSSSSLTSLWRSPSSSSC